MLAYLEGEITYKSPTQIILENNGIGYWVNISLYTFEKIQRQSNVRLLTYLHFGGNIQSQLSVSLFGFFEESERQLFLELLGVSGIGAATVRMILSSFSPGDLQQVILREDVRSLESVKGIGAKTAQRIILELKDRIKKLVKDAPQAVSFSNNIKDEALSALIMLGYSRQQAEQSILKAMKDKPDDFTTEELIKQVLKMK